MEYRPAASFFRRNSMVPEMSDAEASGRIQHFKPMTNAAQYHGRLAPFF
jgi:hypothetical protein